MGRPMIPGVPAAGHVTGGGFWHPGKEDGCVKCEAATPRTFVIHRSDLARCPIKSLSPEHYRRNGTCKCEEATNDGK